MTRIAITGGIAEGKSTVLEYCRVAGCSVASADEVAQKVFGDPEVQEELAALLGVRGLVSRVLVRETAARDPQFRRALNRLTHPRIVARLRGSSAQVIEVPLLIETCLQHEFDRVWVVTCGPIEQNRRLSARYGAETARNLLSVQLPTSAKTPFADRIIRTNDKEQNVKRYVAAIVKNDIGDLRSL